MLERIQAPYRQDDEEPLFPSRKSHPELQVWFKKQLADNPYPMPTEQQTHHFYRSGIYGIEYLGMIRKDDFMANGREQPIIYAEL